ncbi:hypothetical protein GCM10011578_093990 [Streptomyces fuscichromogenes]|uniref:Uncharacterized protein n=2 Tax=Streptomyces fuscichromogenes TaxID=1324013 RepID=A0A917XPI3_9ACTN|nr:hypothetical protein GCM10011578_093990 [Streptomyces fuscichromogenes]
MESHRRVLTAGPPVRNRPVAPSVLCAMASDEQRDHASGRDSLRPKSPAEPALSVPGGPAGARGEPLVGEATKGGPLIVVTAIAVEQSVREALAQRLGPGHIVLDIRDAGPDADIVLIPSASAQLLGILRLRFPQARILATEPLSSCAGG